MFEKRKMDLLESTFEILVLIVLVLDLAFIQEAERGLVEGEKGADFKSCCLQMFLHAVEVFISRHPTKFEKTCLSIGTMASLFFSSLVASKAMNESNILVENYLAACICCNLRVYTVNAISSNVALPSFQNSKHRTIEFNWTNWHFKVIKS